MRCTNVPNVAPVGPLAQTYKYRSLKSGRVVDYFHRLGVPLRKK